LIVDAYCHVGLPRFGSLENAIAVADIFRVDRSVLVLGPMIPDYHTLFRVITTYPDRIRGIGIPFGKNESQQSEIIEIQLRAGVTGIRLSGDEILKYPAVPELIGQSERWIYAVSLMNNPAAVEALISWLDRYPSCRIATPHFLRATTENLVSPLTDLISHPRFFPIFSRHGGLGSQQPYPHTDLKPWVESVVSLCGWEHVMFGSEYPVIFWRDETYASCLDWIRQIDPGVSEEVVVSFSGGRANELLFESPRPHSANQQVDPLDPPPDTSYLDPCVFGSRRAG